MLHSDFLTSWLPLKILDPMTNINKYIAEAPDIESIVQGMGQYADSHRLSRKKVTRMARLASRHRHRLYKGPLILFLLPLALVAFLFFAALPWIILLAAWMKPLISKWLA